MDNSAFEHDWKGRAVNSLSLERDRLTRFRERVASPESHAITDLLGEPMFWMEGDWVAMRIRSTIIGEIDVMLSNINSEIDRLSETAGA